MNDAKCEVIVLAILLMISSVGTGLEQEAKAGGTANATNAPIKEISPGIFQIGVVRLDKQARTITIPASVNMTEGLIEYLLVTATGKTHESLLRTEVEPMHLQVAMLLLGAKGAPASALTNAPPGGQIVGNKGEKAEAPPLPGDPVSVAIEWKADGKTKQIPIEDWVRNLKTKTTMSRGDFTFTGSRMWEGTFIAQREGSIIAAITDGDAMFNNPRPGRENDEIWQVATNKVPAKGTAVTITIKLKR